MKHHIKKLVPAKEITEVDFTTCDICKRPNKLNKGTRDFCNLNDVTITFRDIEMEYPECGCGEKYIYDICEDCFKEKVMPALESLGAVPTVEKWDY